MSDAKPQEVVTLTRREFADLGEYSCSLPTGTRIGKRWKRDANAYRPPVRTSVLGVEFVIPWPEDWILGEYIENPNPEMVGVLWRKIVLQERA